MTCEDCIVYLSHDDFRGRVKKLFDRFTHFPRQQNSDPNQNGEENGRQHIAVSQRLVAQLG